MFSIKLAEKLEAGIHRGGMDVYLEVGMYADSSDDFTKQNFTKAFNDFIKALPSDLDRNNSCGLWVDGVCIQSFGSEGDFKLDIRIARLREDLETLFERGHWWRHTRTGKYKLEAELYRDGNAD